MAYLEITDSKIFTLFKEMIEETSDDRMADKLMKYSLSVSKEWDDYALEVSTLKRMKKMADERLKEMEEI